MTVESLDYYYLRQAYDLLGQRLYGKTWTGREIDVYPQLVSPDELTRRRRPLEARLTDLDRRMTLAGQTVARSLDTNEIEAARRTQDDLVRQRGDAFAGLQSIPEPTEWNRADYLALERCRAVYARLVAALTKGEIAACAGFGLHIRAEMWAEPRQMTVFLEISLARFRDNFSNARRRSVTLRRDPFNAWLRGIVPLVIDETNTPNPELLARAWFAKLFKAPLARKRDAILDEAMKRFSDLSRRKAQQIWNELAPPHVRKAGRRPGKSLR